jgi:type IV secretion system protein VirD4
MINASETREEDENYKNAVDQMFDELEEREPDHFAVRQYKKYKLAAGKTARSILISCGARLAPFDIKELRDLLSYDEMELNLLGDRKTALFVIISDTDDTFNFVVSIMYTQLFNLLCDRADDVYGGRLPVHVRCLLDEFANIGQIPKFNKLIATIRSRKISASIILQLRGVRPFFSSKYDITKHKRYSQLADYNPKLTFDVEKYMKHRLVLKKDEPVEIHEIDLTDGDLGE